MSRPTTTQHDIAKLLGVSQKTISLALRDSERISSDLRQKVLDADKLGYSLSMAGLTIITRSFSSLALVVGTDPDRTTVSLDLLQGILDGSLARERHLQVAKLSDVPHSDERTAPRLIRKFSDNGLLINYSWGAPPELECMIKRHRLPAIWLNALREHDCVRPDDRRAGARCFNELLGAGAKRPLWIDFIISQERLGCGQHYSYVNPAEGFRSAAESAVIDTRIIRPPYDPPYLSEAGQGADRDSARYRWLRRQWSPFRRGLVDRPARSEPSPGSWSPPVHPRRSSGLGPYGWTSNCAGAASCDGSPGSVSPARTHRQTA